MMPAPATDLLTAAGASSEKRILESKFHKLNLWKRNWLMHEPWKIFMTFRGRWRPTTSTAICTAPWIRNRTLLFSYAGTDRLDGAFTAQVIERLVGAVDGPVKMVVRIVNMQDIDPVQAEPLQAVFM